MFSMCVYVCVFTVIELTILVIMSTPQGHSDQLFVASNA